jgi:hypothetical protein
VEILDHHPQEGTVHTKTSFELAFPSAASHGILPVGPQIIFTCSTWVFLWNTESELSRMVILGKLSQLQKEKRPMEFFLFIFLRNNLREEVWGKLGRVYDPVTSTNSNQNCQ